ncbi:MAG: hypothetical protein AB7R89_01970 [Dehalococcoidia bacterium]
MSKIDRDQFLTRRVFSRRMVFVAGAITLLMVALGSLVGLPPAAGQSGPEATVTATLRIASSCLIVSPTEVDFGSLEFTQPAGMRSSAAPSEATAAVTIRNCSSQGQSILVRGGPAVGPGVIWGHAPPGADVCLAPNLFIQGVRDSSGTAKRLTIVDQVFKSLPAGATDPVTLTLIPPCSGSTGAGREVSVKYTFTATLAEHGTR